MPGSDRKYIYIFNDLLKKHNALQPKYHPVGKAIQIAKANATSTTATTKEKPSISLSDVSTNSVVPEEQNSSRRTTSGVSNISTTAHPSSTSNNIVSAAQSTNSYVKSNTFSSSAPFPSVSASFTAGFFPQSPIMTKKSPRQPSSATDTTRNSSATHTTTTSYTHNTQTGTDANTNTTVKFLPPAANKHKRATATHKHHTTFKDSAPNVSQTPTAVMGNSSTQGLTKRKSPTRSSHTSMAKTIAEQTPNAFKTLGPGFNRGAEKSFNKRSSSLSSSNVPSDYEHIFHAPSMISDLPGVPDDSPNEADKKKRKTTKH